MNNLSGEPANWFYVLDGRRQGPFDRAGLIRELLSLEAPEGVLVWRTGLLAWTKAGVLDELKRELPPPVPGALVMEGAPLALPDLPQDGDGEEDVSATDQVQDGDFVSGEEDAPGQSAAEKRRRRRRRKPKSSGVPSYVLPLILLFLGVMLGLWFLLRRMNEVPPGRIIQQSRVAPHGLARLHPC
jgi:GYF domain 2